MLLAVLKHWLLQQIKTETSFVIIIVICYMLHMKCILCNFRFCVCKRNCCICSIAAK